MALRQLPILYLLFPGFLTSWLPDNSRKRLTCPTNSIRTVKRLVMEHVTIWPETYDDWETADCAGVEAALHADPKDCADLTYLRQHTGFCRQIKVTEADLERLAAR